MRCLHLDDMRGGRSLAVESDSGSENQSITRVDSQQATHRNHMCRAVQLSSSTLFLVTVVSQIGIHGGQIIQGSNDPVIYFN